MAGGPILPYSAYPVSPGYTFPNVHVGAGGAGGNIKHTEGLGVAASIPGVVTWRLNFLLPPVLPSGTCKLRLLALADATSGAAKVNPAWGICAVEENPSTTPATSEGTGTITWAAGDNDQFKELKVVLDAYTVAADRVIVMDV